MGMCEDVPGLCGTVGACPLDDGRFAREILHPAAVSVRTTMHEWRVQCVAEQEFDFFLPNTQLGVENKYLDPTSHIDLEPAPISTTRNPSTRVYYLALG